MRGQQDALTISLETLQTVSHKGVRDFQASAFFCGAKFPVAVTEHQQDRLGIFCR